MFPVILIPTEFSDNSGLEQLGTKRKYWFWDEAGKEQLFKAESRGTGEDWAEKLTCELCGLLGLPHATYQLAKEESTATPGVICETFLTPDQTLVMGAQLLSEIDETYPERGTKYGLRQHTVQAVVTAVAVCKKPLAAFTEKLPAGIETAVDVFIGYVMLDMFVANQDRHHENWAAICENEFRYLSPTYDHGASLARNLTDREREERLHTADSQRGIPAFCRKARSAFYDQELDKKTLSTFDAWQAFSNHSPQAATLWMDRLQMISESDIMHLIN